MKRYILPILILVLAFGIMSWLSSMKKDQKRGKPHEFIRTVQTETVHFDKIKPLIEAMGRVYARERISVTPEVSGLVTTDGFNMRKGVSFRKGQVLFRVDKRQALNSLHTIISDLQNALAMLLPELKTDLPEAYAPWHSFFTELKADNIPAPPVTQSQREKLLATRYNIFKLYYSIKNQRLLVDKHSIAAPFSGTVEDANIYPSSMVRAGVAVGTIARTDEMEIELALSRQDAKFVKAGVTAGVAIESNDILINGVVHRISDVLDERMQTVPVFVRVKNAARQGLKSGSYAKVQLEGSLVEHAFSIPRKALHNKNRVYIIQDQALVEKKVDLAYLGIDHAYIINGLEEADELIVEPLQDAVIGMAVQSEEDAIKKQKFKKKGQSGKDAKAQIKKHTGT
jgi:membrane fusion protein (multidrug efflux system)